MKENKFLPEWDVGYYILFVVIVVVEQLEKSFKGCLKSVYLQ